MSFTCEYFECGALAGGTCIVAVDPPSGSTFGRVLAKDLIVTSGQDTPTGTIVLP